MTLADLRLDTGSHPAESGEVCLMELVAVATGSPYSAFPSCTNTVIARVTQRAWDAQKKTDLPRVARDFTLRLAKAHRTPDDRRINVQLAVWSDRSVLHLVPAKHRATAEAAIFAAEGWLAGTTTAEECRAAYRTAAAAAVYAVDAAVYAFAYAAAAVCGAGGAAHATANAAAYAAAAHAYAADAAGAASRLTFLDNLLTEHARLLAEAGYEWTPQPWEPALAAYLDSLVAS